MERRLNLKKPPEDGFIMINVLVGMVTISMIAVILTNTILGTLKPKLAVYEAATTGSKIIETWLIENPEHTLIGTTDYRSSKDFAGSTTINNTMSDVINLPTQENLEYKLVVEKIL